MGSAFHWPSCSKVQSFPSNMRISEVLKQPGHVTSKDVKCKEKKYAKSSHAVFDDCSDSSRSVYSNPTGGNNRVELVTDSSDVKKPLKRRKRKNKGKSPAMTSEKIVSKTGPSKCTIDDALTSCKSSEEPTDSPQTDECLENQVLLDGGVSVRASQICGFSTDPVIQSGQTTPCRNAFNILGPKPEDHSTNCFTKDFLESFSSRHSLQSVSTETINIKSCKSENCDDFSDENTKSDSQCSSICNVHTVTRHDASNKFGHQSYIWKGNEKNRLVWQKTQRNCRGTPTYIVKRYVAKRLNCSNMGRDVTLQDKNFSVDQISGEASLPTSLISFSGNNNGAYTMKSVANAEPLAYRGCHGELLVESSHCTDQKLENSIQSQYVSRSNKAGARETRESEKLKSAINQSPMYEKDGIIKKGSRSNGESYSQLPHQYILPKKGSSQVGSQLHHYNNDDAAQRPIYSCQHVSTFGFHCCGHNHKYFASSVHVLPDIAKLNSTYQGGLQTCMGEKIPRTNHGFGKVFHAPIYGELYSDFRVYNNCEVRDDVAFGTSVHIGVPKGTQNSTLLERSGTAGICKMDHVVGSSLHGSVESESYSNSSLYNERKFRHDATSGTHEKIWVPKGIHDSRMLEVSGSTGICDSYDNSPSPCEEVIDSHIKGNVVSLYGPSAPSDSKSTSLISRQELPSVECTGPKVGSFEIEGQKVENANYLMLCVKKPKDMSQVLIGSEVATEALSTAYRLQLKSESFQLAMGCPLAELERFLCSAAPVICSPYVYGKCAVSSGSQQCYGSQCGNQLPNVPLRAVWDWYEEPGNYGLEVKTEDSHNRQGSHMGSISFRAYFVPYLSAVQLFGCLHHSKCPKGIRVQFNPEKQENGEVELHSTFDRTKFVTHPMGSVVANRRSDDSLRFASSPVCSYDSKLIFEFFESEPPHQRKPLHNKIVELINAGTTYPQVFGDPSKLQSLNLQDLHPESWFSVAWYPIYRIPEGNFRASFLTYHSLGHLVEKCILTGPLNEKTCIVFPVVGLESYNAQAEHWFDLRLPVESYSKESTPLNGAGILREQLRTLEENAFCFATGCVRKDNVKGTSRQRDYEFFISRKH